MDFSQLDNVQKFAVSLGSVGIALIIMGLVFWFILKLLEKMKANAGELQTVPAIGRDSGNFPAVPDPGRCATHGVQIENLINSDAEQWARLNALEDRIAKSNETLAVIDERTKTMKDNNEEIKELLQRIVNKK